jgi:hypothetical protein
MPTTPCCRSTPWDRRAGPGAAVHRDPYLRELVGSQASHHRDLLPRVREEALERAAPPAHDAGLERAIRVPVVVPELGVPVVEPVAGGLRGTVMMAVQTVTGEGRVVELVRTAAAQAVKKMLIDCPSETRCWDTVPITSPPHVNRVSCAWKSGSSARS